MHITTFVRQDQRRSRFVSWMALAALLLLGSLIAWQGTVIAKQKELIRQLYQDSLPKPHGTDGRV